MEGFFCPASNPENQQLVVYEGGGPKYLAGCFIKLYILCWPRG